MNPTITCMADGQVYRSTEPVIKNNTDPQYYVFNSTTVIKIGDSSASTYDCHLTFDPPDLGNNTNYDYVVTNKPNFTANITGERRRVKQFLSHTFMSYFNKYYPNPTTKDKTQT